MNNFHTHTYRCKHASGDVPDYVEAARRAGLGSLGFSDHVPLPDGRWPENRMGLEELPSYLAAVEAAKAAEARPSPARGRVDISCGLECEWSPDYDAFLREDIRGRPEIEYLVSGTHFFLKGGEWRNAAEIGSAAELVAYARHLATSLQSGLFTFVAHPDLFMMGYLPWDEEAKACARDVLGAIAASGLPVEINGYGMRKPSVLAPEGRRWPYPHEGFWDLAASYDLDVIVNSDAHRPVDVAASIEEGRAMARSRGLRLVDTIRFFPSGK